MPSINPPWCGLCQSRELSQEKIPVLLEWAGQSHHQDLQAYAHEPLQGPRGLMWTPPQLGPEASATEPLLILGIIL